jgi:hypothetical protein
MNLVEYRRRWPNHDVRSYIRRRVMGTVPRTPESPSVRRQQKAWGHAMAKALHGPRRDIAALLNDRDVRCHCDKANAHLVEHDWFISVSTSRWSHDPDRRAVPGGYVTALQFAREYSPCAQCSETVRRRGGLFTADTNRLFCGTECASEYGCEQRRGGWYEEDSEGEPDWDDYDDEDEDDCGRVNGIYSYCTYLGGMVGSSTSYKIGTELEIEFPNRGSQRDFVSLITENFRTSEAHCKSDGSLGTYGVEVVTGYGGWQDMSPIATKVCTLALSCDGKSHLTDSCGQHISVARSDMSCEQQARFVVFFNHPDNQDVLKEFARRSEVHWARVCRDKHDDAFIANSKSNGRVPRGEKYEAVNCNHDTHLEVRIFKGSLRAATVIARMALVHLVAQYCEKDITASDLRMPRFLEWVASQDGPEATSVKEYLVHRKQGSLLVTA